MKLTPKQMDLLNSLFALLDSSYLGEDYSLAFKENDFEKMILSSAKYFRNRKAWTIPHLLPPHDINISEAQKVACNEMREVNIDWKFTDGHVNYLFNPTEIKGPVNHEWLWQLNRHSFWEKMAGAYEQTKNEYFAEAFQTQLLDWIEQTSPGENYNGPGSAWRTIESGLRLMGSWPIAFGAFRKSGSIGDKTILLMLASMHQQADHLIHHFTQANWLMMESNGAYTFGSLFPEFTDAKAIRIAAGERLISELEEQILPDGMQYELSPDYHYVVYTCASNLYFIAQYLDQTEELPANFKVLLKKAADAYLDMATPGFTQPRTNDCYTLSTDTLIKKAASIFPENQDYLYVTSNRQDGLPPEDETASRFLPYAGLCAMRSGWESDAVYLCFDVGPLGMAHIHQDKLNINLYKGRQELIFDDGGGQYEISNAREYALSAADHNTVLVDGLGQNRTVPKKLDDPVECGWISNAEFDYAYGIYDDAFGPDHVFSAIHKRQIRFCKPDFFVIRDDLLSQDGKKHDYELLLHMDTLHVNYIKKYHGAVCSDFGKDYDVLIIPISEDVSEEISAVSGQTEPYYRGWYIGRNESNQHPATTLGRRIVSKEKYRFITLLFVLSKEDTLPEVETKNQNLTVTYHGHKYRLDLEQLDR